MGCLEVVFRNSSSDFVEAWDAHGGGVVLMLRGGNASCDWRK